MTIGSDKPTARRFFGAGFRRSQRPGRWVLALISVVGLCLAFASCSGLLGDPKIELNPQPTKRYGIIVTFENAPGPFDSIEAHVDYGVTDYSCVPEQSVSGARLLPSKRVDLKLRKVSETTYETDMYVDLLKDKDFYSKGVCHWSEASFSVVASRGRMKFMTPLPNFRYPSDVEETRNFSFSAYERRSTDMLNTGNKDRGAYPEPSKTFSIRVNAKEMR